MLLEGIFLPLTTPFHPDGRLYLGKLESNVRRYSLSAAAGMVVAGRAGEAASLTDTETREVLQATIQAAANEKVMIACVGRPSVFATLALARFASAAGYDAIAAARPETATDAEALLYFQTVADQSPLPLVLQSELRALETRLVLQLAAHPNILGMIDDQASPERLREIAAGTAAFTREVTVTTIFAAATGRMLRRSQQASGGILSEAALRSGSASAGPAVPALKTRKKRVGFQVLAGSAVGMLESWRAGASGAVPTLAACAPQACSEVWQAFRDGDEPLAEEKQERIRSVAARTEAPDGVAALKYGCDLNGYFGGRPRLPRLPLTLEGRTALENDLRLIRN